MTLRTITFLIGIFLLAPSAHAASISVKTEGPVPTCSVRVSKNRITSGSTTVITWKSDHARLMTGLIRGKVSAPNGKERLAIGFPGKQTFTLQFAGPGGISTCSVNVFVHKKK